MELRHATLKTNLESIRRDGLLPAKSRGKRQAVWLHAFSRTPWAILHTITRHRARLRDVIILTVDVPRSWVTRHQTGLWYCASVIPRERIIAVADGADWARSPVLDN